MPELAPRATPKLTSGEREAYARKGYVVPAYRVPSARMTALADALDETLALNPETRPERLRARETITPPFGAAEPLRGAALLVACIERLCAFVEQTDHHVGRVLAFLDELGELDNTLIMLASDNGASAQGGPHGSFNELQYPNRIEPTVKGNLERLDDWGGVRSYPNYSWGWAWAGNTPLRRWKRYLDQGGMSDPLIVHWPAGISARGEMRRHYVHAVDVAPTILDAVGVEPPATLNGVTQRPLEGVSFAASFAHANARTDKRVQYYEMLGSRAIWADGWKAVTEQPQGELLSASDLGEQKWELYHVAEDFSECDDLAEAFPAKFDELVERRWVEAGKYNVLPLDARVQARMVERKPQAAPERERFVYYPGGAPQFEYTAVNLKNRSHVICAEVEIPPEGAEGVLLAHGSWLSGYSLYVRDDVLHYVHNYLGLAECRVSGRAPLPRGATTLELRFVRTGEHAGIATLAVGGQEVGVGEIPRTIPSVIETSGEGLCCGFDERAVMMYS